MSRHSRPQAQVFASRLAARGHRIGVCGWSLRPASAADLVEALRRLKLDTVQLALSPLVHQPEAWSDAATVLRGAGIDILSGMMALRGEDYSTLESIARTGGVRPDATWSENLEHARAVAALARREGIGLVTFHAGFIPHDPRDSERSRLLDRLATIADTFADAGVAIAFETGQETAQTLVQALDDIDRGNVGVNFDPANMILYGMGDPIAALTTLLPRVRQIHVKDALPTHEPGTWGREVAAGAGGVDWPAFFEIAMKIQPPVNFLIERESGSGSREPDIEAARDLAARLTGG
jgi:sugar phosphate isomerase/epimerase